MAEQWLKFHVEHSLQRVIFYPVISESSESSPFYGEPSLEGFPADHRRGGSFGSIGGAEPGSILHPFGGCCLGDGLFSLRLCGYVSFIGSAKDMFQRIREEKARGSFQRMYRLFAGKKVAWKSLELLSVFFCCLHQGNPMESEENQFDLPRPLLPKHHAWKEHDHFFKKESI